MKKAINLSLIVFTLLVLSACQVDGVSDAKQQAQKLADGAVALIEAEGVPAACNQLREKDSEWFHGDSYVFVWTMDNIRVCFPPDLSKEGQNTSDLVDSNGKKIGELFIELAASGGGWIDYQYPKPGATETSSKSTYIQKAVYDDIEYLVGSGVYTD